MAIGYETTAGVNGSWRSGRNRQQDLRTKPWRIVGKRKEGILKKVIEKRKGFKKR
jgi:hypothetical protein